MENIQRTLGIGGSSNNPRVVNKSLLLVRITRLNGLIKLLASFKIDPVNVDGFGSVVEERDVSRSSAAKGSKAGNSRRLANGDQVGTGVSPRASGVVDDGAVYVISRERVEDGEGDVGVDDPGMTDEGLLVVLGVGCEGLVQLEFSIKVNPVDFDFDVQAIDEGDDRGRAAVDGPKAGLEQRWVRNKVLLEINDRVKT
jgi:hypothetical protein